MFLKVIFKIDNASVWVHYGSGVAGILASHEIFWARKPLHINF